MAKEQKAIPDVGSVRVNEYRDRIETAFRFPIKSNRDALVGFTVLAIIIGFFNIDLAEGTGGGIIMAIPTVIAFGYLAQAGAAAASGAETIPPIRLTDRSWLIQAIKDGFKPVLILSALMLVVMLLVLIPGVILEIITPFTIQPYLVYLATVPVFLLVVYLFPALFVYAGRTESYRETFSRGKLTELKQVVTTKEYVTSLIVVVLFLTAGNLINTVLSYIPIIGAIVGWFVTLYFALAAMCEAGWSYSEVVR